MKHFIILRKILLICSLLSIIQTTSYAQMHIFPLEDELCSAITAHNNDEIIKLLNLGISVNSKATNTKNPALTVAVYASNLDAAEILLQHGANINILDSSRNTPLMVAVIQNDIAMVNLLIKHSPDINIKNNFGFTPLNYAIQQNKNNGIEKILLDYKQGLINLNSSIDHKIDNTPSFNNIYNQTRSSIDQTKTSLIILDTNYIIQSKNEAPKLKNFNNFLNQIGYHLWRRGFSPLSHGLNNVEDQEIALITPYSFSKYLYFINGASFKEPNPMHIQNILNKNDIIYIAIYSPRTNFGIRHGFLPAPRITNVVLKINNKIYQPVESNALSIFNSSSFNNMQLFAFPIELFHQDNTPFKILLADSWTEQAAYEVTSKKLNKWK